MRSDDSLIVKGLIGESDDTRAFVTITRPDTTIGLPKRKPSRPYILKTASKETLPVLKLEGGAGGADLGRAHYEFECLSQRSWTSSSWGWTSDKPMTQQWI
jgi:hypothetical protein